MRTVVNIIFVFCLLCTTILSSCNHDPRDNAKAIPPNSLLQKDVFIEVMADIQLLEAASKGKVFRNDDASKKVSEGYAEIFNKHGITLELFEKSHTWWWEHPAAMKSVLIEVTQKLTLMEEEVRQDPAFSDK
jgi:hypothetical protein